MKAIKISLTLAVVGLISYFIFNSLQGSPKKDNVQQTNNKQVAEIEHKITKLSNLPNDKFCNVTYEEIKYLIKEYYKNKLLGNDDNQNEYWKKILNKELDFTYTNKFINQANYIFKGADWKVVDLNFIKKESSLLRSSIFLEKNSEIDNSLIKIQKIIFKYEEINNYIKSTKSFVYTEVSLSTKFPISNLEASLADLDKYRKKQQEYPLKNCIGLNNQLNNLRSKLLNSYLIYLEYKVDNWVGKYKDYDLNSFNEYKSLFYKPLMQELDDFEQWTKNNNFNFDVDKFNNIMNELKRDSKNAYNYLP